MAYDEQLAERIRKIALKKKGVTEKKMFGGIAFLLYGKMGCGIVKDELLVRVPKEEHEAHLTQPGTRTMDFTGKPMKGFIFVSPKETRKDAVLRKWVDVSMQTALALKDS